MSIKLIKEISDKQRIWRNSPEVMAYTRGSELLSEKDQERWLERIENDKSIQMFGIQLTDMTADAIEFRENVGTCGLCSISMIHRTAEWSLLIGPEYQGKGYATEAFRLLLNYGFNQIGLQRIWGEIFVNNEASKHIAEKFGFKEEGRLRKTYFKNGEYTDSIIVGLLREEWNQKD